MVIHVRVCVLWRKRPSKRTTISHMSNVWYLYTVAREERYVSMCSLHATHSLTHTSQAHISPVTSTSRTKITTNDFSFPFSISLKFQRHSHSRPTLLCKTRSLDREP